MREALGEASPLADAVFALQGLGTTPILLAEPRRRRTAGSGRSPQGKVMTAFAMTEPGAGSDVAAIATTARREDRLRPRRQQDADLQRGNRRPLHRVRLDRPRQGRQGHQLLPGAGRHARAPVRGPQVLSAPHPLGEIAFDDCRVPAEALLGSEGRGYALGLATLDRLRPTVAAAACGMAARALAEALAHVSGASSSATRWRSSSWCSRSSPGWRPISPPRGC